jgi:hypothetical protein
MEVVMKTIADGDHDTAERIMRKVFGIDERVWPNALCGLIERAIQDARLETAQSVRDAMLMAATPPHKDG